MGAGPLAEAKQMLGLKLLNIQKCFVRFDEVRVVVGVRGRNPVDPEE